MAKPTFTGFTLDLMKFLDQLERNNHRPWFDENRQRYESVLREPALEFITAMQDPMKKVSQHFRVEPKKVGGSLMRIHRDTRFSHDKTPYKTNVGIHFRHVKGKDVHAPGYYFHVDLNQVFVGAGIWHPDSNALTKIRKHIDRHQDRWTKIIQAKKFTKYFVQDGDSLKRPPRGYKSDHPLLDELRRKDHFGLCRLDHDFMMKKNVVSETIKRYSAAHDYMTFLCEALKLKF